MIVATLYALPLWQEITHLIVPPAFMLGAAVVHVLNSHRWARYTYWITIGAGVAYYVSQVMAAGWRELIPHGPDDSIYDPRWTLRFAVKLIAVVAVLVAVSLPFWRRWVRWKCGLADRHV
jgi:hypothetical protein